MKEYFTASYEQKRKNKLIELNEKYNQLLSTYNSESDSIKKTDAAKELYKYNSLIMTELDEYLDLIEAQVSILASKSDELKDINLKLSNLENENDIIIDYSNDITELKKTTRTTNIVNILLLIICVALLVIFFFFALVVINVKKK
jgi:hypothetical protein